MAYLVPDPVRTIEAVNFTDSYMPIGGTLAADAVLVRINNATNQPVLVSFDGVNDVDYVESGMTFELACVPGQNAIQAGTQFYIDGFAGPYNWGTVYLSVYYDIT